MEISFSATALPTGFRRPKEGSHPLCGRLLPAPLALVLVLAMAAVPGRAQTTATWDRKAAGQQYLSCFVDGKWVNYYYPSNNNWTQAQHWGPDCSGTPFGVMDQPSNWTTPGYPDGPEMNVVLGLLGGVRTYLNTNVNINKLTVSTDGGLTIGSGAGITANSFEVAGNFGIRAGGGGGAAPYLRINPGGQMTKSADGGTFQIDTNVVLTALNAVFEVPAGTLALPCHGSVYSNCTFKVTGGLLDWLGGGQTATAGGTLTGSGYGRVNLSGTLNCGTEGLVLDFPTNLFHWMAGQISSDILLINAGHVHVDGPVSVYRHSLDNHGWLILGYGSAFSLSQSALNNFSDGTVMLTRDVGISGSNARFVNTGLMAKSGGAGNSVVSVPFDNLGGTVQVESGTLTLAGGGTSSNGTFNVGAGAVLDVTGAGASTWAGRFTGSGAGTVALRGVGINVVAPDGLTLDFPADLFQWTGGTLASQTKLTNTGAITIGGAVSVSSSVLENAGTIRQAAGGALSLSLSTLDNLAGGSVILATDAGLSGNLLKNQGLLRKSAGTGTSVLTVHCNNLGGTIQVDSGTLSLAAGGTSSNGTFNVNAGAVLDITGATASTWSGRVTGSGEGTVALRGGSINVLAPVGLTLDFPANLFLWSGGTLASLARLTNSGSITIGGSVTLSGSVLENAGTIRQTAGGALSLSGSTLNNRAGGSVIFGTDAGLAGGSIHNWGLLRKTGGLGNSAVSSTFVGHGGNVAVDSGTITLASSSFDQAGGTLSFQLGGREAGQSGRLSVAGAATLGGPLVVTLAGGFVPRSDEQFQILTCGSRSGAFSTVSLPAGLAVNYTSTGVFLSATNVPKMAPPQLMGGNFTFGFPTVAGHTYTVYAADQVASPDWTMFTNLTGDGAFKQFTVPVSVAPQRFYRVLEP